MWARGGYVTAPWAGPNATSSASGGSTLPPPIPGATSTYTYLTQAVGAWGMQPWAGPMTTVAGTVGGISISPDPDLGVMRIWAWWPDAASFQLVRVGQDGVATPVRGGFARTVTGLTRRNRATNPSLEAGLNGYVPGTGSPTLARISTLGGAVGTNRRNLATNPSFGVSTTGWAAYNAGSSIARTAMTTPSLAVPTGEHGLLATCTSAGTWGATHTVTVPALASQYYTASAYVMPSVARDVRIWMEWRDASSTVLATNFATSTNVQPGVWTRVEINRVAPPTAVTLRLSVTGQLGAVSDTLKVDAVLLERAANGAPAGSYFDGNALGAGWDGTVDESSSSHIVVDSVPGGNYALRATIATAGTCEITVPHSAPAAGTLTVGAHLRFSALPTTATITVGTADSTGAALAPAVATLSANERSDSTGQFSRRVHSVTLPVGAATVTTIKIAATGLPADGYIDLDTLTVETGVTDGSYVDGATLGGTWTGVANLSTSVAAPVQVLLDGECPLDTPVTYVIANPAATGGRVSSTSATLESGDRVWLTHPSDPEEPIRAYITTTPDVTYELDQSAFPILDSRYPVVVSSAVRQAPAGEVEFVVTSFAERDHLVYETFGDGTPVLKRTPADMGYGEGEWVVLGSIVEPNAGYSPTDPVRTLRAPYRVVEAPEAVT